MAAHEWLEKAEGYSHNDEVYYMRVGPISVETGCPNLRLTKGIRLKSISKAAAALSEKSDTRTSEVCSAVWERVRIIVLSNYKF